MKNKRIKYIVQIMLLVVIFTAASGVEAVEFFTDSFETGDTSHVDGTSGARWTDKNCGGSDPDECGHAPDLVEVSTDMWHSGTHSLKFTFSGSPDLADMAYAEQRYTTGQHMTEFYLRYYIYYPSNFTIRDSTAADNNKVGTTWGEIYTDRAKFNMEWLPGPSVGFKIPAHNDYPHDTPVCEGAIARGMPAAQYQRWTMDNSYLGRWVSWEFHYKMDDGSGNGAYDLFIDGSNVISARNLSFEGAPCRPGYMLNGYLMGWANSGFDEDTAIYIDDVVFSDTYIGPMDEDLTAPVIAQTTPIPTPTNDHTPDYAFSSTEPGTITYTGDCSSSTTSAVTGNNTITLNTLSNGTYSNCTITVTDSSNNTSTPLPINTFTINTNPTLSTRADVDQDGNINTTDVMLSLRNSLGLSMANTNWQASETTGDANCDGISNSTDALLIFRTSLELDTIGTGWCVS